MPRDLVAAGWTARDERLIELLRTSRGLPRFFPALWNSRNAELRHAHALFGADSSAEYLRRLYDAWKASIERTGGDVAVRALQAFDAELPRVTVRREDAAQCFQLADKGVLLFDEHESSIGFLHWADVAHSVLHFGTVGANGGLSLAEQLSLLAPALASADEINEHVVARCLAWTSAREGRGLQFGGTRVPRLTALDEHVLIENGEKAVDMTALAAAQRNTLFKEFPDEFGGDCVAVCVVDHGRASRHLLLLRVQVKMSSADASTVVAAPLATAWADKLTRNSETMRAQLQDMTSMPVAACNVLWTTQKLTESACDAVREADVHIVDAANMLTYLDARTRAFVDRHRLAHFGWRRA